MKMLKLKGSRNGNIVMINFDHVTDIDVDNSGMSRIGLVDGSEYEVVESIETIWTMLGDRSNVRT